MTTAAPIVNVGYGAGAGIAVWHGVVTTVAGSTLDRTASTRLTLVVCLQSLLAVERRGVPHGRVVPPHFPTSSRLALQAPSQAAPRSTVGVDIDGAVFDNVPLTTTHERERLLDTFDRMTPGIPDRPRAEVETWLKRVG